MDLNDPRRRLQVLNNASPSIRMATAPQQKLTVAPAVQPKLINAAPENPVPQVQPNTYKSLSKTGEKNKTIFGMNAAFLLPKGYEKVATYGAGKDIQSNPEQFLKDFDSLDETGGVKGAYVADLKKKSATDAVAAQTLKLLQDNGRFKGDFEDFATGANDKLYGGMSRGFLRGVDFLLPGKNTWGLEQEADRQDGPAQFTTAGKVGEKFGSVEKGVVDAAMLAVGSGAAEAGASKIPAFTSFVNKVKEGGLAGRAAAKVLSVLPGSLGGSATDVLQTAGRGDKQNVGKSFATGAAVDVGIPFLGKGLKLGKNLFKGEGSKSINFIEDLISETDPGKIKNVLGVDTEIADYLAKETNPETVKTVLQQLEVDPNINLSDEVRKRLQEEGITRVERAESQYGAEYQDGVIRATDQQNLDENVYHELGHHVWKNKLTPEEKALFEGIDGAASKEAAGRAGYTADDITSEDFSDFMRKAMEGKLNEVPESVRAVVQKYAKVAAQEADNVGVALPNSVTPATPEVPAPTGLADNPNITGVPEGTPAVANAAPEIPGVQRGPNGEVIDAAKAIEAPVVDPTAPKPQEDLEAIAKTQGGTSEGAVTGSGQTTSPEGAVGDSVGQLDNNTELGSNALKTAENGSQGQFAQKAEDIVPNADDETKRAVQEVMDSLNSAEGEYNIAAKARSKEKAVRAAKADAAYEAAGGGEAGMQAKLSALRGAYTKSGYKAIDVSPQAQQTILDSIQNSESLSSFGKANLQNALRKVWGTMDGTPRPYEIRYIREHFGDELADSVKEAVDSSPKSWLDHLKSAAATPRAAMATLDLSAPLRQGGVLGTRFPKEWATAAKDSVKYFGSEEQFKKGMEEIASRPSYELMRKAKLAVDGAEGVTGAEEQFLSSLLETDTAKKLLIGKPVAASDRGYTGFLTKLRADVFDHIVTDYKKSGVDLDDDQLQALGKFINSASGRGDGRITNAISGLDVLFSPKLWKSRLDLLNPAYYAKLDPVARKYALQSSASFAATAGAILTLAAQIPGVDVGMDPRSADFAKIKYGNTRYDILGGLQQNIRLGAQLITNKKIDSQTGEVATIGDGYTAKTRKDMLYDFFENKENPLIAYATKLMSTKVKDGETTDEFGQPFSAAKEAGKLFVPLNIQSTADTTGDTGNLAKAGLMNLPGIFGAGVQTYGDTPTKEQGPKDAKTALPSFKGTIQPDMVLDNNGKPMLDEKGKVIRVKFEKDATELQKKAQLAEAQRSAYKSEFTRSLSKEDQQLVKLSDTELNDYVKDGTIDQERFDQIKRYQKKAETHGKPIDIPKEVTSDSAKTFYEKWNSMTKKDQDYWLKEAPDENATKIAEAVNKERAEGLSEYKPSNELSKAYAEYEKDILSHPEYTEVDKRNKAKGFQAFAYKLNYTPDQRDIYTEGGSSDIETLINDKAISKEDLDAAIQMDNELFNSGLVGSLKFSKKFRNSHGYAVPAGKGGSGSGSGGSGAGGGTQRAYLSALLPSESSGGKGSSAPQFSEKRRNGISFKNVNTPKKGAAKKVSINL